MASRFWARLERPDGSIVEDPAWTPQRQFLWEFVHDTRGLAREEALYDHLERIRLIDTGLGRGGPRFAHDPAALRSSYQALLERIRERGDNAPKFRLVREAGENEWAAAKMFTEAGAEYALVGGWTGPFLRQISPETEEAIVGTEDKVQVGTRRFEVRAVPFLEYFAEDLRGLFEILGRAEREGLRVRCLQR